MSNKALLAVSDQKERLSFVYVRALAAKAGYVVSTPEVDRDSVDLRIESGRSMHPFLDFQLKATTVLGDPREGFLSFRLSRKNYDDLRLTTMVPRFLVVLELPEERERWLTVSKEKLVMRRRAYYLSLQEEGLEAVDTKSVTVHIPECNLFTVNSLCALMRRAERRYLDR